MNIDTLPEFLRAGGDLGARVGAIAWDATPLGPIERWPLVIRATLATWLDSPQPMFVAWGDDLRFFHNASYAPFLADRQHDAMGRPFAELWSDIWADIEPIVREALAGRGSRFEDMPLTMVRNGRPEATWWTFTYMPLRDEHGRIVGMMCTAVDATQKVLVDRQAALEREQQQLLLQQMPGFAALLHGPGHVYRYANDAYRRLSGSRELEGRSVREVFPELAEQGFVGLLDHVYASGVPYVEPAVAVRLAGEATERFLDLLFHPIKDASGDVIGIFVGGHDVTPRIRAERDIRALNETLEQRVNEGAAKLVNAQNALRQAQKLEAVGQLTGGVAHDFNNLLMVIGTSLALLRRPDLPEERRARYMDSIAETVKRAAKLTAQLLAFARRQPLSPTVFDVGACIETVADLMHPLVGPRVRVELSLREGCFARADINQFETALLNLAANARDAMGGEGRLDIRLAAAREVPPLRGQERREGDFVAVSVSDSGSGIDPANLEAIFEPFYTTKEVGKGTGLGLSQVFGFAKQSGGDIDVRSAPGEGATFTLYLPCADEPLHAPEPGDGAPEEAGSAVRGARILVVEDNESVGELSTALLQDMGYTTERAADADAALRALSAGGPPIDLVFSDVVMPGMSGIELARVVRQRHPGVPVVLASGYSHALADDGRHGFPLIQKPYTAEALGAALRQALARRTR